MDHLLDVECKQEHVTDTADLLSKARLLKMHFETHGTPVMIGGDAYAYTIVGVVVFLRPAFSRTVVVQSAKSITGVSLYCLLQVLTPT